MKFKLGGRMKRKPLPQPLYPETLSQDDAVNPSHYKRGKIEVIDFIQDQQLNFTLGNAVKYVCRAGYKDPSKYAEDLDKAVRYIDLEIKEYNRKKRS